MTAYVSIQIAKDLRLDLHKTLFTVSENAATTPGTSALLRTGQKVKIYDLLHALMLPSGNDAAMTLAESLGEYLINQKKSKSTVRAKLATPNHEKQGE